MKRSTIVEIISVLFVILFLYTGISKLMEYAVFKKQVAESPILKPFAWWIAWGIPLTEFAVAVLLLLPRWRLRGLYSALGLMLLFTGYIIAILGFSEHLPCSCGGVLESLSWRAHLIFNSVFIILASAGILVKKQLHKRTGESQSLIIS